MTGGSLRLYLLFHLNLAYSSLDEPKRRVVIERCYWPLLRLAEEFNLPMGVEVSGYTLEMIEAIEPSWVAKLRELNARGTCELIGSGYGQIIGPLAPATVNARNMALGQQVYQRLIGAQPEIALVNEQAFAPGLIAHYVAAGYRAIAMEWENPAAAHPEWSRDWQYAPQYAVDHHGNRIALLWTHSLAFQQMQRYAHGELSLERYMAFIQRQQGSNVRYMAAYSNDVETFDFRPGRYLTEAPLHPDGEWKRLRRAFDKLMSMPGISFVLPSHVLQASDCSEAGHELMLSTAAQPVPVKKQRKYNVSRWAVTGRDDAKLNTLGHRLARALTAATAPDQDWYRLLRLWASDLRTHVTDARWQAAQRDMHALAQRYGVALEMVPQASNGVSEVATRTSDTPPANWRVTRDREKTLLSLQGPRVRLTLNLKKGIALHSAAFASQEFVATLGTVEHGYFDSIELGADFYSAGTVIELPKEHRRITDLVPTSVAVEWSDDCVTVTAHIETPYGCIAKAYVISLLDEWIDVSVRFPGWQRPYGSVRVSAATLLPDALPGPLSVEVANGGAQRERYALREAVTHAAPVSSTVSCSTGFGATDGTLVIGQHERAIALTWDPADCAVFTMVQHQSAAPGHLTRVFLSLSELDDTFRDGGTLGFVRYRISPARFS